MTTTKLPKRLGFFTRVLDVAGAAERYRLATEQIIHAERFGFDSAWVAQHHFHEDEGGLPGPLVFLAQVAAQTPRIRLGTAIVTLPLELPIRVAEDAAVLDLISGGRLEVGVGPGGQPLRIRSVRPRQRRATDAARCGISACCAMPGPDGSSPAATGSIHRLRTSSTASGRRRFSVEGARRAGAAGDGLMLSRTQPRPTELPTSRWPRSRTR